MSCRKVGSGRTNGIFRYLNSYIAVVTLCFWRTTRSLKEPRLGTRFHGE
jgi:hypothetical protein